MNSIHLANGLCDSWCIVKRKVMMSYKHSIAADDALYGQKEEYGRLAYKLKETKQNKRRNKESIVAEEEVSYPSYHLLISLFDKAKAMAYDRIR